MKPIDDPVFLELRERALRAGFWLERRNWSKLHRRQLWVKPTGGEWRQLRTANELEAIVSAPPVPTVAELSKTPEGRAQLIADLRRNEEALVQLADRAAGDLIERAKHPNRT